MSFWQKSLIKGIPSGKAITVTCMLAEFFVFQLDESTDVLRTYQHFIEMCYCLVTEKFAPAESFLLLLLFCFVVFVVVGGGGSDWLSFFFKPLLPGKVALVPLIKPQQLSYRRGYTWSVNKRHCTKV